MSNGKDSKQIDVLRFIYEEVKEHGYPPTVREICNAVGLSSTSTVHGHLSRLEKNGYIQRDPSKPRAIELTQIGLKAIGATATAIPMLGTVTAGSPILAIEEANGFFPIPPDLQQDAEDLFMLTIKGDSMINVGVYSGDKIIVKRCSTASNGDMVVAMVDDSATVKTFYKEKGYFRLQPENDSMEPIIVDQVDIIGKVIGLIRMY